MGWKCSARRVASASLLPWPMVPSSEALPNRLFHHMSKPPTASEVISPYFDHSGLTFRTGFRSRGDRPRPTASA